jgi:hypothetical protein
MLPRWHILLGFVFALMIFIVSPNINPIYLALVFFSSFLIDFDHYLCSLFKTKKLGLFHSFAYHREMNKQAIKDRADGKREKGDFHIFHTVEFHLLVGLLGFYWIGFFYIFIGMVFHSLLDIVSILYDDFMYAREFFLVAWLYKKLKRN